jgi:hypothetical protein
MKRALILAGLFVVFTVGLVVMQQQDADARLATTPQVSALAADLAAPVGVSEPEAQPRKKCSFNSDCRYGKCKKGKCGGCSFQSDCKGWGKCKGGWCGACSFQSDCKGWGKCSGGRCTKSPY